jgi:hypothetical protein
VVPAESLRHPEARETLAAWARGGTTVVTGPPDAERYARALADARIRPAFDVEGADASVLVYAAPFRSAALYVIASEGARAVTVRVTPRGSGRSFAQALAPGRAALVLVGRRDARVLARYPA